MSPRLRTAAFVLAAAFIALLATGCTGDPVPDITGQRYEAAEYLCQSAGFRVGRIKYDADADGPMGYIVRQSPRAESLATPGDDIDIVIAGPELVIVPMLIGRQADDVVYDIEDAGLRRGPGMEQYHDFIPAGVVIDQDLAPGTRAPKGTKLKYVVSLGPEDAPVPPVVGRWETDAQAFLYDVGFKSKIDRDNSAEPEGVVIQQWPDARTELDLGERVDLTVSKGPKLENVPDVIGRPLRDAQSELRSVGMRSTVKLAPGFSLEDPEDGVVYSQQPLAGQSVVAGIEVVIYVREP